MMYSVKKKGKDILAACVYFVYEKHLLPCPIKVYSIDETLDELLCTNKSLVRFGDGEIMMIKGARITLQNASPEISKGLSEILRYRYDDLIVTIPDVFQSLAEHRKASRQFWKDHLLFCRKIYRTYCNRNRIYGSTFVSRCYYFAEDKRRCRGWFAKIKALWQDKDIVVVEGARTHNGVGNDLLSSAHSVERIICPSKDAYGALEQILAECRKYEKDKLFLLSVGVAAKFIAYALFQDGYRVLDIGNLDIEYEWFLRNAADKITLAKHDVVGIRANEEAGYYEYLAQVKVWL